jgi:hypothetical protein
MGHTSFTTERYAHLRTDLSRPEDDDRFGVELRAGRADVAAIRTQGAAVGYALATPAQEGAADLAASD